MVSEEKDTVEVNSKEGKEFSEGEKVLAYHGPLIYQAKVQEVELKDGVWLYYLHYLGWSKKWDEWVESSRLLKDTPENNDKKKKLLEEASAEKKRNRLNSGGPGQKDKSKDAQMDDDTTTDKNKRRRSESGTENSGTSNQMKREDSPIDNMQETTISIQEVKSDQDQFVKIPIPPPLKKHLVEDWRSITEEGRLVKLPRNPTVEDVLQKFLQSETIDDNALEVSSGLRAYFDRALPAILLYKQERQQYAENFPEGTEKTPAEVYGAEHLLRLFIKLPELLSYIEMDDETGSVLLEKLTELLRFLQRNQDAFFLQHYDGPKVDITSKPSLEKAETDPENS